MEMISDYRKKEAVDEYIVMGRQHKSTDTNIMFPNGYYVLIIPQLAPKYSVSVHAADGCFAEINVPGYGEKSMFYCDTEQDIINICEYVKNVECDDTFLEWCGFQVC